MPIPHKGANSAQRCNFRTRCNSAPRRQSSTRAPIPHTVQIPFVAPVSQRVPILHSGATLALRRRFRTQVPTPTPCASRLERTQVQFRTQVLSRPRRCRARHAGRWPVSLALFNQSRWLGCRGCNGKWALRPSGELRHLQVTVPHSSNALASDGVSECCEWRTAYTVEEKALATETWREHWLRRPPLVHKPACRPEQTSRPVLGAHPRGTSLTSTRVNADAERLPELDRRRFCRRIVRKSWPTSAN